MKFIYGFYVYSTGKIEPTWLNLSLMKSFKYTDYYNNQLNRTVTGVIKLDMGTESSDKIPMVDLNSPIQIKSIEEIFGEMVQTKSEVMRGRGRPRKTEGEHANH